MTDREKQMVLSARDVMQHYNYQLPERLQHALRKMADALQPYDNDMPYTQKVLS